MNNVIKLTENQSYGCRQCNTNLTSNNPASQYQRQKIIQNTVRVPCSLYTMNLASLAGYQHKLTEYQTINNFNSQYITPPNVSWNQMSDRAKPSIQLVKTGGYGVSSTKHTVVKNRPGAMSPGGIGVDIKHNSYERRLNKLKGKSVLRRGTVPINYGNPIVFNKLNPIYGGKIIKPSIISGYDCPNSIITNNNRIYGPESNSIQSQILNIKYTFNVNDYVYAKKPTNDEIIYKAQIKSITKSITGDTYTIEFIDDDTTMNTTENELMPYYDCSCSFNSSIKEEIIKNTYSIENITDLNNASMTFACYLANQVTQC
jgi:hypothetical protein